MTALATIGVLIAAAVVAWAGCCIHAARTILFLYEHETD